MPKQMTATTPAATSHQKSVRFQIAVSRSRKKRTTAATTSGSSTSAAVYLKPVAKPIPAPDSRYQRSRPSSSTRNAPYSATATGKNVATSVTAMREYVTGRNANVSSAAATSATADPHQRRATTKV